MKNQAVYTSLILLILLFSSCQRKTADKDARAILEEANFNFSHKKRSYHQGVYFFLPEYLKKDYSVGHLIQDDGLSLSNQDISLHFSIERFNEEDAQDFRFAQNWNKSNVEAVQNFYLAKRGSSLTNASSAIINENPKGSRLNGIHQFMSGKATFFAENAMYFISTVEKKVDGQTYYYVIQFVTTPELAAYLRDDFLQTVKNMY
ncbi:MAG: hypothetical protein EP338_06815 [Bacteroidetes bacterium]|nr:MAG: hypothetical protein EP338_06815 [Bacteroidota bacterium]